MPEASKNYSDNITRLKDAINRADSIVIGAGAGLSASAGFIYTGARFERHFSDFIDKYHFTDMYSGGFYPFPSREEFWAYWSRYVFVNRYMDPPKYDGAKPRCHICMHQLRRDCLSR